MDRGQHHVVLARLRDEIRRIERRPARSTGRVPSGRADVDALLPGGGFPRGALSELTGGPASGKTALALAVFASLAADELAAFVDARGELYPPAAAALGVDLGRLLIVRPHAGPRPSGLGDPALGALWAAEALLGSGAFAAVAMDVAVPRALRGADAALRRLVTAAEKGGAVGLWLAGSASDVRVPALLRLELAAEDGKVVARRTVGGVVVPAPSREAGHVA